ncbi:MAG: nuclear transport factor 2 family protein [Salibacteraceae bacterium]
MRNRILGMWLLSLLAITACTAQTTNPTPPMIEKIIEAYVAGGDQNNSLVYQNYQSPDFRVAFNNTAKNTLSIMDNSTYNTMIDNKTFGGDTRKVIMEEVQLHGDQIATVKVRLEGKKAIFYNLFSLAKVNGEWLLVQDMVYMTPKAAG